LKTNTYRKAKKDVLETMYSYNNRVKTLSRTFSQGIDRLINFNQADEVGIKYFKYGGNPTPERDFCREHFGKIYHIDEIEKLNNEQIPDVMVNCGGYNCRHFWLVSTKKNTNLDITIKGKIYTYLC
jgi:hypothetical protein